MCQHAPQGPDVMTKMAEALGLRLNPNETWQAQTTLGNPRLTGTQPGECR